MNLGEFELQVLSDGTFALDGGQIFGIIPKVLWEKKLSADLRNRVRLGINALLVRTRKYSVLVDTGIGDKFDAKNADIYGLSEAGTLPNELKKLGIEPGDIDIVINSHLHFDHCGWNVRREGANLVPTFPRARYYIQRGEWEHAYHPNERDHASYVRDFFHYAEVQTELIEGDQEIVPGIRVEVLAGHTQHMQGVRIESGGQTAYFLADLVPTRHHLPLPWIMSVDLFPMETLANKKRLLSELAKRGAVVILPHDAEVPWARLADEDGKVVAIPVGESS
jgi:glyoxylase-like metal-dependent hydrolase (beta-lactamase superfamily II)